MPVSEGRPTEPARPRGRLRDSDDETLAGVGLLAALGSFAVWRLAATRPLLLASAVVVTAVAALAGVWVRARVRDCAAERRDPSGPGVVIGSVRGGWWLARRRRFVIPWTALTQHVLIDGPTGRGKTFTFIAPLLRANVARPDTGVFYLDGKGDRIDRPDGDQPGVVFDFVFSPEDPGGSARWNPLGGPDPMQAAREFAAALFPEAAGASANFYEARAVFAITRVAPAMALTGFGLEAEAEGATWHREQVLAALIAAGLTGAAARQLLRQASLERCARQLRWLPYRPPGRDLAELVRRDAAPNPRTPLALLNGTGGEVTPAALSHVLFAEGRLEQLSERLGTTRRDAGRRRRREDVTALLGQLEHDVAVLTGLPRRERAAMLANLQNRLGYFLAPPFLELCSRSDFRVADVCDGRRLAFLLPTGAFPDVARPLGRVALAQFKSAVLASAPGRRKVAILDEFHNFVSPDFDAFLAQARSRGGSAVMAVQSLAQLADGPAGRDLMDRMLANIATVIVTPGCRPFDANYWAEAFGEQPTPHASYSYEPAGPLTPRPRPSVRVEQRDALRFTATEIAELPAGRALIQLTDRRTAYPPTVVDVERG